MSGGCEIRHSFIHAFIFYLCGAGNDRRYGAAFIFYAVDLPVRYCSLDKASEGQREDPEPCPCHCVHAVELPLLYMRVETVE